MFIMPYNALQTHASYKFYTQFICAGFLLILFTFSVNNIFEFSSFVL